MMRQEEMKDFLNRMLVPDSVQKVEFPPFDVPQGKDRMKISINFIEEIQVGITAELGRTTMKIRDILKLVEGSIIELEQPAGENAHVLVNEQKFGTGEVVVIGGNFGIRMDSIYQNEKRESAGKP